MHQSPPRARATAARAAASLLSCTLLACERPPSATTEAAVSQRGAPIVGGDLETGWSGVGALTVVLPLDGYLGAFCTATLVAPSWVLTAAHCVTRRDGPDLDPAFLRFLVGTDARPASADGPIDGALYALDLIRVHPEYDRITLANDLALLHLATPASDVDAYTLHAPHSDDLAITGQDALYVGFGATEGVDESGAGLKRSAMVRVTRVSATSITSAFAGSGTCFGDSGGPVLFDFQDTWRLVGVSSAGVYCDPAHNPSCPPDPCHTQSIATRVDPHADWIAEVIAAPLDGCEEDVGADCAAPDTAEVAEADVTDDVAPAPDTAAVAEADVIDDVAPAPETADARDDTRPDTTDARDGDDGPDDDDAGPDTTPEIIAEPGDPPPRAERTSTAATDPGGCRAGAPVMSVMSVGFVGLLCLRLRARHPRSGARRVYARRRHVLR